MFVGSVAQTEVDSITCDAPLIQKVMSANTNRSEAVKACDHSGVCSSTPYMFYGTRQMEKGLTRGTSLSIPSNKVLSRNTTHGAV